MMGLQELVRQAERVLDAQIRAIEEGDARCRHWMTTTVALYGASAALVALTDGHTARLPTTLMLAMSLVAGGRAFVVFARAYGGDRMHEARLAIGWEPDHLASAVERRATRDEVLSATVVAARDWIHENGRVQVDGAHHRRRGQYWLLTAAAALAAALIYSVGAHPS